MKPCTSLRKMPAGPQRSAQQIVASPVMWIIDIISVGTLTSSSAAAMRRVVVGKGLPAGIESLGHDAVPLLATADAASKPHTLP